MSETLIFSPLDQPLNQPTQRREGVQSVPRVKMPALKLFVGVLVAIFLFEMLFYFILIPSLSQMKFVFEGINQYQPADIYAVLGENATKKWFHFDSASAASALSSSSGIESVSVEKRFPDRVIIRVVERVPIAVTLATINGRSVPVLIDKNGVIFSALVSLDETTLPLVTGLPFEANGAGIRLPKTYREFLEQIALLHSLPQKYLTALSEIHVVPKEYGGYELILYPIHSKIHSQKRVLMDKGLNEEALQYMMVALDVINSVDPDATEIDLRYGSVSYRSAGR